MARSRKFGRSLSGILLLNKPMGMTSNFALQKAKRLFFANKAGHTGSLDPLATGVLPICFGEATKFSQYLLDSDKRYRSTFRLGVVTTTADSEGDVIRSQTARHISRASVESELQAFRGDILQIPPMVSALKVNGQPLYKLARAGIEVERKARPVIIYKFDILAFREGDIAEVDVDVHCTKGTYIRSLASDLGDALGVGGHVAALHRSQAGSFSEDQSYDFEQIENQCSGREPQILDSLLLPIQAAVPHLPEIILDPSAGHYFCQGQAIMDARVYRLGGQGDTVRVCQNDGSFIGVGEITDDGRIAPRRVVVLS